MGGDRIIVIDTETTGVMKFARLVSLAAIRYEDGEFHDYIYRVYDPRKDNEDGAERVHGWDDWTLRFQPLFADEAQEVYEWLSWADTLVMHNAEFDMRFLQRELRKAGAPQLDKRERCTMEWFRDLFPGESARLDDCLEHIGLSRHSEKHGAFEDALLTGALYSFLSGSKRDVEWGTEWPKPSNLHHAQIRPEGVLPRRPMKRAGSTPRKVDKASLEAVTNAASAPSTILSFIARAGEGERLGAVVSDIVESARRRLNIGHYGPLSEAATSRLLSHAPTVHDVSRAVASILGDEDARLALPRQITELVNRTGGATDREIEAMGYVRNEIIRLSRFG
ncbi:3'-5' exonuclease [Pseudochelatococcus sp. B33]